MSKSLGTLENLLGYKFKDIQHLERAVTHRSWAYENLPGETEEKIRGSENESMEFVGDSVLGLAVAEELFRRHPSVSEGDLTVMKHHLVSGITLAKAAERLGLGNFVRFGQSERKTGGRKKQSLLTNTLEAVIAAIFLDGGYLAARLFITNLMAGEIKDATPGRSVDFKSQLQTALQAIKLDPPVYKVLKTEGQPHARTFSVEAVWQTGKARGRGNSIKAAEMMAASEALKEINAETSDNSKRD